MSNWWKFDKNFVFLLSVLKSTCIYEWFSQRQILRFSRVALNINCILACKVPYQHNMGGKLWWSWRLTHTPTCTNAYYLSHQSYQSMHCRFVVLARAYILVPWVVYKESLDYIMYENLCILTQNTKQVTKCDNNSIIHQADLLLIHVPFVFMEEAIIQCWLGNKL